MVELSRKTRSWRLPKKIFKSKPTGRKRQKPKELKVTSKRREMPDEARMRALSDAKRMWRLRMKFLAQAKKYFGTPYARKYWTAEDPEFHSPLFLDCCGLVRKILRDLRQDFGFRVGPWNQAYLCDTLPITVEREQDMKPGDLVFISAIYNNPRSKKQKHNMTHVEIWLGDSVKTIGARWQKGKVQVFDSYMFNATSYHSPTYTFKSIDTWLMGVCRSHCSEHAWRLRSATFVPCKKSIFAIESKSPHPNGDDENASSDSDADSDELTDISEHTQRLSLRNSPRRPSLARTRSLPVVTQPRKDTKTNIRRSRSDDVIARVSSTYHMSSLSVKSRNSSNATKLPAVSVT